MTKKFFYYIFSLFCAIVFWFAIISAKQNIMIYDKPILVKYINQSDDISIINSNIYVDAKIDISDYVGDISSDDFNAYIDMSNYLDDSSVYDIYLESTNDKIRVVSYYPTQGSVLTESKTSKLFDIKLFPKNNPIDDYKVSSVDFSVNSAEVYAGPSIINNIKEVGAYFDFDEKGANAIKESIVLSVLDEYGNDIPNVFIDPISVDVLISFDKKDSEKYVGVKPLINKEYTPNSLYINNFIFKPELVKISGSSDLLADIDYVLSEEIHLSEIDLDRKFYVNLISPLGVDIIGDDEIEVSVEYDYIDLNN